MWVDNGSYNYHILSSAKRWRDIGVHFLISEVSFLSVLVMVPDRCMSSGNITEACPKLFEPDYIGEIFKKLWEDYNNFNAYNSDNSLFTLK